VVGFEPTISCSRRTRIPRLSHTLNLESAQRELNPHICPGRAARYRYIMGAERRTELSKINCQSTRWDSNPRPRITGAVSSPLDDQCLCLQWDRTDLNRHQPS
jgi:hypothetical protein